MWGVGTTLGQAVFDCLIHKDFFNTYRQNDAV